MHDEPSPPVEQSPANAAERGIYDVGSKFTVIYREIGQGVTDALGRRVDREDWLDTVQDLAVAAWLMFCSDPECFPGGAARRWASRAARYRHLNRERDDRKRTIRDELLMQEFLAGNLDARSIEQALDDEESRGAIGHVFQLLEPRRRAALIERLLGDQKCHEGAVKLGVSDRTFKRLVAEGRRDAAILLSDFNPRASPTHGRGASKRESHLKTGPQLLRSSTPLQPPPLRERGSHDQPG